MGEKNSAPRGVCARWSSFWMGIWEGSEGKQTRAETLRAENSDGLKESDVGTRVLEGALNGNTKRTLHLCGICLHRKQ